MLNIRVHPIYILNCINNSLCKSIEGNQSDISKHLISGIMKSYYKIVNAEEKVDDVFASGIFIL